MAIPLNAITDSATTGRAADPPIRGVDGRDIAELLAPQGPRTQPLPGFDADYADIVDYILRCTHRIWEQKDLGLIETHYAADCRVHLMTGPTVGAATVIAGTARTLSAFPDRTLIGEAVIWSDEGEGRYLSSHRITSQGLNLGPSEFGPATGRRACFLTIADCLCAQNRVIEEWLVRDNSALVLSLGLSPRAVARAQAIADREQGTSPQEWRLAAMDAVRAAPRGSFPSATLPDPHAQPEAFAHAFFAAGWSHRRFALVRTAYDPAARWTGPGGRRLFGHGEISGWMTALIGTIGDARFSVDHVAATPAGDDRLDIAVRWSLAGTHDGDALYGAASGRPLYILAVTHWRIVAGRIAEEVTIFDEIALLRQIEGGL